MLKVAIIGGGMAGLAAASQLAPSGIAVTIFESAKQVGGRARGVAYKNTQLDNGQHILAGAYHDTLNLLKQAGVAESQAFARLPLQLQVWDLQQKRQFSLKACPTLPAPLHILAGLLAAQGFSWRDKLVAIRLMLYLRLNQFKLKQDEALSNFLAKHQQTPQLIKALWEPLCLAALNTPLAEASAQVFCNVLRDSFARKKRDSDLLLPRTDLNQLLAKPLTAWIAEHGAEILLGATVKSIEKTGDIFQVSTQNKIYTFSHVIIASAPHQLAHVTLPAGIGDACKHFEYQPITTVYLQFSPQMRLPAPMLGFCESTTQWVFDHSHTHSQAGLLAVVISASQAASGLKNETLAATIVQELNAAFPHLGAPLWTKVITEKFATFACTPALTRPAGQTNVKKLYLTGDYVAGESALANYPATIEGAVRSGLQVAHLLQSLL